MMGFSSSLQGRSSHEALVIRQDFELRALENLKRWLVSKIKCDREYAAALSSLTPSSLKVDKTEELTGSMLLQAIHAAVDTTEAIAVLLKQNAEYLCNVTLEKLNTVINDKRNSRKYYQDEYNRMILELAALQESVNRSKAEYEKTLESFKTTKCKYDEQCSNKGKGMGKKQEEVIRDKFQRAVKRLHNAHNDYVLALLEAGDCERDFRTVLIPGLLEYQQAVQEDTVLQCRLILKEIFQYTDLSSDTYRKYFCELHNKVEEITAQSEYKDFIEKYRSPPPVPQPPIFDSKLSAVQENNHSYPLRPDHITVDDQTLENLKQRLKLLEQRLGTVQSDLSSKQNVFQKHETELQEMKGEQASETEKSVIRRNCEGLRRQINELKCIEQKWQRQVDIIAEAVSSLSGKIPIGCELHFNETVFTTVYLDEEPIPAVAAGLSEKEWFHGVLPREEVVRLLVNEGDFLVRETTRHEERQVVLSVCWVGHKHFIVQTTQEGFYRFEGPAFPTVQELIAHQLESGLPVTTKSGAVLKKAIPRETWELNNDDVELVEKIGSGNFGDVYQARLHPSGMTVAVKTCRHTLPDEQKKKFLQEGRILKQYEHPNVVRLIGICVQKQPIMIVMELVPGGSLLNFLRQKSNYLTVLQLICMCSDVAAGMAYLESRNCIHRDLAVRNCLVGENNVVKISDFGMSREEQEYIVSDGMKQIPIKWTAPEALNYGKYTSLCDVWSFGVLCWEVFSRGGIPYSGLSNTKARQMIGAGYRMPAPEGTPDEMYRLMRRCWEYEPERRPHFEEICRMLDSIKKQFA